MPRRGALASSALVLVASSSFPRGASAAVLLQHPSSYSALLHRPARFRRRLPHSCSLCTASAAAAAASAANNSSDKIVAGLAFDLETTGLDINSCEIVQLAVVVANSQKGAKFCSLVLPEGPIDESASNVHGFTREVLVARGARPFSVVWDECVAWLDGLLGPTRPIVWAAHNGNRFDRPILCRLVQQQQHQQQQQQQRREEEAAEQREEERLDPPLPGALPPILSAPRASWLDTLPLARSALPHRPYVQGRAGPYTLGALYSSATGGATLDGAHDALADAEALATVWKWLVADSGADGASLRWAAHLREDASADVRFQTHLQYHGLRMGSSSGGGGGGGKRRSTRGSGGRSGASEDAAALQSLQRVSGIGPYVARRLTQKGIESYDGLEGVWRERGRDGKKMLTWMKHSMPGANALVLAAAVKGMQDEWGATVKLGPSPKRR